MRKLGPLMAAAVLMLSGVAAFAADAAVSIQDSSFNPSSVTIDEGNSVTWTHNGQAIHTVTADDGSFDSGNMTNGNTFARTFNTAGTYRYYCKIHGGPNGQGMSGRVVVRDQSPRPKATTDPFQPNPNNTPRPQVGGEELAKTGAQPIVVAFGGALVLIVGASMRRVRKRN